MDPVPAVGVHTTVTGPVGNLTSRILRVLGFERPPVQPCVLSQAPWLPGVAHLGVLKRPGTLICNVHTETHISHPTGRSFGLSQPVSICRRLKLSQTSSSCPPFSGQIAPHSQSWSNAAMKSLCSVSSSACFIFFFALNMPDREKGVRV